MRHTRAAVLAVTVWLASCASQPPQAPPAPEPVPEAPPAPAPPVVVNPSGITFAAVGDIMLGTDYPENILPDDDGVSFLAGVTPVLSSADIAFGNLEGVLMDGGEAVKRCRPAARRTRSGAAPAAPPAASTTTPGGAVPAAPPAASTTTPGGAVPAAPPAASAAAPGGATAMPSAGRAATTAEGATAPVASTAAPTEAAATPGTSAAQGSQARSQSAPEASPQAVAPAPAAQFDVERADKPAASDEDSKEANSGEAPAAEATQQAATAAPAAGGESPSTAGAPATTAPPDSTEGTPSTAPTPNTAATPNTAPTPSAAAAPSTTGAPGTPAATTTAPGSGATPTASANPAPSATPGGLDTSANPAPAGGSCYVFRSPTRYAKYLTDAGFDVMSLANNHAQDFGDPGRDSSMRALDEVGIHHSGREGDVAYWTARDRRFAMVAFAPNVGSHQLNDLVRAQEIVTALAKNNDIVIVSFHGGAEGDGAQRLPFAREIYAGEDRGNVVEFARTVVDAGADLVIGHGPHVMRPIELYRDRLIAYSLGNFATYYGISVNGIRGTSGVLTTRLADDGKFMEARFTSTVQIRPGGPQPDPENRAVRQLRDLTAEAFPDGALHIGEDGTITRKP